MVVTMKDWNGKEIRIEQSKRGKISVCDYKDNLIILPNSIWPHPDIVKKLYKSIHINAFDEHARFELSRKLGFYCDLQSLRSEDAITWSVFGTLQCFPKEKQVKFVNSLLARMKGVDKKLKVNDCLIQLWTRIAHPDTLVSGGPELDVLIVGDKLVVFVESKWKAKIAKDQGKKRDKDQLQLRMEFLQKYGNRMFHEATDSLVLLVGLSRPQNHNCPFISWEEICNKTHHPLRKEVKSYYL